MNPGIVILEYEEKESIDGITWSFSISRWSADLILQAHTVAEPRPDQLQQLETYLLS